MDTLTTRIQFGLRTQSTATATLHRYPKEIDCSHSKLSTSPWHVSTVLIDGVCSQSLHTARHSMSVLKYQTLSPAAHSISCKLAYLSSCLDAAQVPKLSAHTEWCQPRTGVYFFGRSHEKMIMKRTGCNLAAAASLHCTHHRTLLWKSLKCIKCQLYNDPGYMAPAGGLKHKHHVPLLRNP